MSESAITYHLCCVCGGILCAGQPYVTTRGGSLRHRDCVVGPRAIVGSGIVDGAAHARAGEIAVTTDMNQTLAALCPVCGQGIDALRQPVAYDNHAQQWHLECARKTGVAPAKIKYPHGTVLVPGVVTLADSWLIDGKPFNNSVRFLTSEIVAVSEIKQQSDHDTAKALCGIKVGYFPMFAVFLRNNPRPLYCARVDKATWLPPETETLPSGTVIHRPVEQPDDSPSSVATREFHGQMVRALDANASQVRR